MEKGLLSKQKMEINIMNNETNFFLNSKKTYKIALSIDYDHYIVQLDDLFYKLKWN